MRETLAPSAAVEWKKTSYTGGLPAVANDRDGLTPTKWLSSHKRIDGPKVRQATIATLRDPRCGEPYEIRVYIDTEGRQYAHLEDAEMFVDQRITVGAVSADCILSVEDLFTVVDVDALIALVQRMLQTPPTKSQRRSWQNARALIAELPTMLAKIAPAATRVIP